MVWKESWPTVKPWHLAVRARARRIVLETKDEIVNEATAEQNNDHRAEFRRVRHGPWRSDCRHLRLANGHRPRATRRIRVVRAAAATISDCRLGSEHVERPRRLSFRVETNVGQFHSLHTGALHWQGGRGAPENRLDDSPLAREQQRACNRGAARRRTGVAPVSSNHR